MKSSIYNVSYFNLRGLEALFWGQSPPPVATGLVALHPWFSDSYSVLRFPEQGLVNVVD